ncbi:DUF2190 family protein [Stomatohabitans albus]|uniref:DUF2190 family protein n=1 Tax=Stomatohabitans albus TaxID=3110766 RepID=UPI00300C4426
MRVFKFGPDAAITCEAEEALTAGQTVMVGSEPGKVKVATAGKVYFGVAATDVGVGEPVTVHRQGILRMVAGAAVTVGSVVKTGAGGKVVPGTGLAEAGAVGIALDKAAKDSDAITVDVRN